MEIKMATTKSLMVMLFFSTAVAAAGTVAVSVTVRRGAATYLSRVSFVFHYHPGAKGAQVGGEYRGNVRRGSKRLFVLWTRAKTPTGVIAALASPATDALGRAGFDGDIDTHFFERFGSALLLSIVNDASSIGRQQLQDSSI